jgi:hypothetical protein
MHERREIAAIRGLAGQSSSPGKIWEVAYFGHEAEWRVREVDG